MEETKKNSKGLIILVIILIICVLGLGGYIVYDKLSTKSTPTTDNTKSSTTKLLDNNNINEILTITNRECTEKDMLNVVVNNNKELYLVLDNKQIKMENIKVKQIEFVRSPFACDENSLLILTQSGDLYYANNLYYDIKEVSENEINISELKNTKLISEKTTFISGVLEDVNKISVNVNNENMELKNIVLANWD